METLFTIEDENGDIFSKITEYKNSKKQLS